MLRAIEGEKECVSENLYNLIVYSSKVVGYTASEIYGWSYPSIGGSLIQQYTPDKALDEFVTPVRRYIYLENYNLDIGFTKSGMPTAERVLCDFIKYPDKLGAMIYCSEALEGYIKENDSFDKIYSMMADLCISKEKLYKYIDTMYIGSNMEAIEKMA